MRYPIIDQIRGFAVLIMIIFHLFYDLNLFHFIEIDFYQFGFWYLYPRFIVFLFLFCVGLSLPLPNTPNINWKKFFKRFATISSLALSISLITYLVFPNKWIYFGTLHCIALCSLTGLIFLKIPRAGMLVGVSIISAHISGLLEIPWIKLNHPAMDYIPFFPWVGVTLIGLYFNSLGFHKIKLPHNFAMNYLSILGKHALIIYLIHQPILFGLTYFLSMIH